LYLPHRTAHYPLLQTSASNFPIDLNQLSFLGQRYALHPLKINRCSTQEMGKQSSNLRFSIWAQSLASEKNPETAVFALDYLELRSSLISLNK